MDVFPLVADRRADWINLLPPNRGTVPRRPLVISLL